MLPPAHRRCHAALFVVISFAGAWAEPNGIRMKINPLSEEQANSLVMPYEFRCDACKAVLYKIDKYLTKFQPKDLDEVKGREGQTAVSEHAALLVEGFEETCSRANFDDYGMKDMGSVRVLNGPGIDKEGQGVVQGGGSWPKRISALCLAMVEEAGEIELAKLWRGGKDKLDKLCAEDCGEGTSKERKRKKSSSKSSATEGTAPRSAPTATLKAAPTGLEDLPAPPHMSLQFARDTFGDFLANKLKFKFVMFYDASSRGAHAVHMVELAARELAKAGKKILRKVGIARYDSTTGDTWNFPLKQLPAALFWRKGYERAKIFDGSLNGPSDLVDWIKHEVLDVYMKDDPEKFPRTTKDEL